MLETFALNADIEQLVSLITNTFDFRDLLTVILSIPRQKTSTLSTLTRSSLTTSSSRISPTPYGAPRPPPHHCNLPLAKTKFAQFGSSSKNLDIDYKGFAIFTDGGTNTLDSVLERLCSRSHTPSVLCLPSSLLSSRISRIARQKRVCATRLPSVY